MAKSDEEILYEVDRTEPHLTISMFITRKELQEAKIIRAYRLAESEQESNYRKLVEGLRVAFSTSAYKEMVLKTTIESLITEIEGDNNDKAEG